MNLVDFFLNLFNFIINFISEHLFWFQFVSLFISGILLGFSIYFTIAVNLFGEKIEHYMDVLSAKNISRRRTLRVWKQIQKRLKTREANQIKLAILEADKILGEILKMAGYPGKNSDERLENINPAQLSNIKEIKQVHRIRHRIANEPDFIITPEEAEIIIAIYEKAFQEFNLIG